MNYWPTNESGLSCIPLLGDHLSKVCCDRRSVWRTWRSREVERPILLRNTNCHNTTITSTYLLVYSLTLATFPHRSGIGVLAWLYVFTLNRFFLLENFNSAAWCHTACLHYSKWNHSNEMNCEFKKKNRRKKWDESSSCQCLDSVVMTWLVPSALPLIAF